ncbi:phage late control D family protein [Pectobacterium brasiliense]|uniref:phage late control D family protein n=1 Tax=Pectobacterium brasiliense TaxID=180957 RepID=UPI0015DE3F31|nr:phage late control D family protein [Pectobacterium brasiliense]MBA0216739.1 phage late control D family protein [Pectobacterium brasiliense]MBN3073350.1 phage late control D family protein [Pectobacterium brasiliense]MBN3169118.1 phage late control D family protein [Pectobacterium brasiliense]
MINPLNVRAGSKTAPAYLLRLNEQDITTVISPRLLSLSLTDNRGFEADQLDIELDDSDGLLQLPRRGAVLSVFLGWEGEALIGKGDFTVDEIEHRGTPDTMTIRARSADFRGSLNSRRELSYHDTTLGAIVEQVAKRNNLAPMLADGFAGIKIPHIDQTQETDAKFITRLAERNGAIVAIKAGRLLFIRPGTGKTASGKPIPQQIIERSDGDQHSFSLADRGAYTGVTASWLHTPKPEKPKTVKVKRQKKVLLHQGPQPHPKAKKAKKEPEAREGDYLVGTDENVLALTTVFATKAEAMRAAEAKWNKLQRGVAEFSITLAMGRADLFPETPVQVSGFKQVIDEQPWTISKVTHSLSNSGYVTALELEVLLSEAGYGISEQ